MKKGIDHTGVNVVFYCHDGKGNFLMNKRSKYCRDEVGRWDPGGGAVKLHEPILKTLRREVKEEYNATVKGIEFLGYRDVHRTDPKGRKTHWIALDYKVLINPKRVKNGEPKKHEMIGWFRLDQLPKPVHSQFPLFLKLYKTKLS